MALLFCFTCSASRHSLAPAVAARPVMRSASSQMIFGRPPPAPPAPPPTTPATEIVQRDLVGYASLLALGVVPAVDWGPDAVNPARLAYFSLVAVGTLYLGVQRQDIGEASPIDGKSAALAPVFASVTLGGLYLVIKYTGLNPGGLYQFFACLFALLAASDLLQPIAGLGLAGALLDDPAEQPYDEKREADIMNSGAAPAFAIAIAVVIGYAQGPVSTGGTLALPVFAALNNLLGWSISMVSLGVLALDSFVAAASLLGGLFVYDAFFVFKSDVMVTVATQIEAPAKFLFAAVREAGDTRYPFSVLGLGDVVVPGAFVSLLRQVDVDGLEADTSGVKPSARSSATKRGSEVDFVYFYAGVGAYAAGLAATFVANYVTKAGQPALVYIVPSLLLTAVATAASRGELPQLLAYKSKRAEAAKVKRDDMKAEWKAKKAKEQADTK